MVLRKKERIPNVLTIAGVDPSGGAGLLADVKAMSARGVFAAGVPTALTAQNTRGVSGVMPVPPEFVAAELEAVMSDLDVAAVKIGMLNDAEVIGVVAEALERRRPRWIVLDPVMIAKSGDRLLREDALEALRRRLLPLATLVTPNLPEAAALLDEPVVADESALPALAYICAVNSAAGYVCHMMALEKTSAQEASLIFFLKPMIAPLFAFLFLREEITANMLLGIVCFLVGSGIAILPGLIAQKKQRA